MTEDAKLVVTLGWVLAVSAALHLFCVWGETNLTHVTAHARLATWEMVHGRFHRFFLASVLLTLTALLAPWGGTLVALPALLGLLAFEHAYVQAGQSVPLA